MSDYNFPEINLTDFDYELPSEKIAEFPLEQRQNSKLLFVNKSTGSITHHQFYEIPELIPSGTLLILNTSKVIPARLFFKKETGSFVELLCISPIEPSTEPQKAMQAYGKCIWKCIMGGRRIKAGMILEPNFDISNLNQGQSFNFKAKIKSIEKNEAIVEFFYDKNTTFGEILEIYGKTPLPPYIKRKPNIQDKSRYQTIYADYEGSVAAPTAGLHFTKEILCQLTQNDIVLCDLVLHVGPGTFIPIKGDSVSKHVMHEEQISININELIKIYEQLKQKPDKPIIAAGTTSVRTIESLYWLGNLILSNQNQFKDGNFYIDQYEPYRNQNTNIVEPHNSIYSLIEFCEKNNLETINGKTKLLIVPGYEFKIIKGMITNFHQPKSTLILLVAAFLGKDLWKLAYSVALNNNYRFLSYGDACLFM